MYFLECKSPNFTKKIFKFCIWLSNWQQVNIHSDKDLVPDMPQSFIWINAGFFSRMHTLQWRHNEHNGVSNRQPRDCLLNRLFRRRSKKTSKLRVTGLCAENTPVTGEFNVQMTSNVKNVSIWWRHREWEVLLIKTVLTYSFAFSFNVNYMLFYEIKYPAMYWHTISWIDVNNIFAQRTQVSFYVAL